MRAIECQVSGIVGNNTGLVNVLGPLGSGQKLKALESLSSLGLGHHILAKPDNLSSSLTANLLNGADILGCRPRPSL